MAEPVVIGNETIKFVKDATSKQMTLWTKETPAYYSAETGAGTYQVPVGKKFIILQVRVMRQQTHLNTPIIFETATSGAAVGTIIFNAPVIDDTLMIYNTYIEVGAGQFFGNWGLTNISMVIYGVELDV